MHKVDLKVFSFNDKAINLYKKLGFKEEGRNREAIYRNGFYQDIINMGLLENEYKEIN
ncbi:GNAT family N-acetyltransferase [Staphylococcus haemolyticus]|uniref:GNAT family N-acetyltransferase n=1 Tax=Staphylococcus haemolyticus TaxID=1283 RepID=UPI0027962231|nr:GNAT family protein [Staphylococcus haemolyticus]